MSDEDEEDEEGKSSSNSSGQTTPKRKTKADVQKKSLIMGRIFKKGGKREKQKENIATKADMVASCVGSKASAMDPTTKATTKTAMAKDFDKLFDTLKNASSQAETDVDRIKRPAGDECCFHSVVSEKEPNGIFDSDIMEGKMREFLEHHSPTRHDGSKMFNRLRRTATFRQKKLTETWDSDEYEDFHSDDIMGLIDRAGDREKNANDEALSTLAERANSTESKKSVCEPYIVGLSLKPRCDQTERQQVKEMEHDGSELMGKLSVPLTENKQPATTMDVVITDDTIRKVMESVILETMNQKGAPIAGTNRKSSTKSQTLSNRTSRITTTSENHGAHVCKDKEDSQANTVDRLPDDTQELTTSLNEHVLESSVVISSQTITTKFKQKLNISRRNTTNSERGSGSKAKGQTGNESSFVVAKHSGRGRPPMAMTTGGKQKKSAPRKMKNVAYDPDSDYEHSIKYKKVKRKLLESDIEANLKIEQLQSSLNSDSSILLSTPRRKRNAGDMLYYWSSSSDEEELSDEGGLGICDRTATKEEKLQHRHPPMVNKSSPVEKQSRDSIKPRMKNSESTGDILLVDNANDGNDAGNVGHGDYRVAFTKSSARQPSDVGSFEPNGGKSKQNSTKPPPNIFESTVTATIGGTNDEGTTTGKHVRGRKQQLQQSTEGKPSSGYDIVPDTGSNSENLQQHGWIRTAAPGRFWYDVEKNG
uniref:Uncharacterized protein n=1 Tax=Anopheles atroparvus TaxID=41427 RepID=A0A182JKL7_ANOAO